MSGDEDVRWAKLAEFGAPHEAELARQLLEGQDIPAVVQGDSTGIFGPGFSGATALGHRVLVPSDRVEEAREALTDLLDAFGGDASDEPED